MRQRNVKNKQMIINNSQYIILNPQDFVGNWHKVFNNTNPIYLEIGMGKGDFILENALRNPHINYIGIEKSESIMALAIKKIEKVEITNLRLICINASLISSIFDKEIDKIYLNFSDPWPKMRHSKRRLTSANFLREYDKIFRCEHHIEMKTDNQNLFEYSLISFNANGYLIQDISLDLHNSAKDDNIMTEFEKKYQEEGKIIYYVCVVK